MFRPFKTAYILVGVPCSGKSTFVDRLIDHNTVIASTDDFITERATFTGKSYNDIFKSTYKEAEAQMYEDIKNFHGSEWANKLIWDQTNTTIKSRKAKLEKLDIDEVIAVYLPTNLKICLERNEKRLDKSLKPDIIVDMHKRLQEPTYDEGFDEIWTINNNPSKGETS